MTEPHPEPARPTGGGGSLPWRWQLVVAGLLLAVFVGIGVLMIAWADSSDTVWKNRIVVFSAFQSLIFGAVGWFFGREVNRVPAEQARADAREAKEQADDSADEAAEARVRAAAEETRGRALAAAVTSTAASMNGQHRDGSGTYERPTNGSSPQLTALATMADELYGSR